MLHTITTLIKFLNRKKRKTLRSYLLPEIKYPILIQRVVFLMRWYYFHSLLELSFIIWEH